MIKRHGWAVVGAAACIVGCQAAPEDHTSYLLLDRGAREAGFAVEGAEVDQQAVLPIEVEPQIELTVVGPSGCIAVTPGEDELVQVRGADGALERHALGNAVDLDRLQIKGSEQAAKALAEVLAGELVQNDDGSFEIRAENALAEASRVQAPAGLVEVLPTSPEADEPAAKKALSPAAPQRGAIAAQQGSRSAKAAPPGAQTSLLAAGMDQLPPAVSCADPVVGVWMSHSFHPELGEWYAFTLTIRRQIGSPSTLIGEIRSEFWSGGPSDARTPSCEGEGFGHGLVAMSARGSLTGDKLSFGGVSWRADKLTCNNHTWSNQYNLDQFSGVIDGSNFVGVNNDGGRSVDDPTQFRRVACH